ncbi:type II toxin-antitoxin system RelE/ParE family toxin [Streptomyces kunmingensis]|uniref:Type II toxin-antitoxin system RelE/ParE family toxin n=1 Tax=Streptomyces kunmingensis TaxID=68225 RepID=A0ABU6CCG6_9ACTN|nr:type II toxin-antitoxin system RelE/ParE family toxin [Streptomyces kunmingensis]MEB3962408.1 type II toxin-antitoxin system RelE/ParE family toxin [Streptomyces kunmingensis]
MSEQRPWIIEIEPEVRDWLSLLSHTQCAFVERVADRLLPDPLAASGPYAKSLGGNLRELRFHLGDIAVRIPYWLAPDRRIVLLTVFRKTRMNEHGEVERARVVQKLRESEHDAATHEFDRSGEDA